MKESPTSLPPLRTTDLDREAWATIAAALTRYGFDHAKECRVCKAQAKAIEPDDADPCAESLRLTFLADVASGISKEAGDGSE